MNVTKRKIADLRPATLNVRKHPEKQIEELTRSYEMFGQYRPLVISAEGEILVGNGLYEAMKRLGAEDIEVIELPADTPKKYKEKLMLADNKTFQLGTDNLENIDIIFNSMNEFNIPGFDEETLKELYGLLDAPTEVSGVGIVSDETIERINQVNENRIANPPTEPIKSDKQSAYEAPVNAPAATQTEHSGSYINCPHCGAKIYI